VPATRTAGHNRTDRYSSSPELGVATGPFGIWSSRSRRRSATPMSSMGTVARRQYLEALQISLMG